MCASVSLCASDHTCKIEGVCCTDFLEICELIENIHWADYLQASSLLSPSEHSLQFVILLILLLLLLLQGGLLTTTAT